VPFKVESGVLIGPLAQTAIENLLPSFKLRETKKTILIILYKSLWKTNGGVVAHIPMRKYAKITTTAVVVKNETCVHIQAQTFNNSKQKC